MLYPLLIDKNYFNNYCNDSRGSTIKIQKMQVSFMNSGKTKQTFYFIRFFQENIKYLKNTW